MPKARSTLTLDEGLLVQLQHCAKLQGVSLSSLVNDWLTDTLSSIYHYSQAISGERQHVQHRVAEINSALQVIQEGYAQVRQVGKAGGAAREPAIAPRRLAIPPSSNTGGKVPSGQKGRRA